MNKHLLELLKLDYIQQRVSSILLATNYVKIIDNTKPNSYSNLAITDEGFKLLNIHSDVNAVFIVKYRNKFPAGKKSTPDEVKSKLINFKLENPSITEDDILKATDIYLDTLESERFCEKAGNFISKRMGNGVIRSTLSEYIEILKQQEEKIDDSYGNDLII